MNIEAMKAPTSQHWKSWFTTPIPMLSNETPAKAVETEIGRKRLKSLLLFYAGERHRSHINANIPYEYAMSKLNYSFDRVANLEAYVNEEAIFNFKDEVRATRREERHTSRLEQRMLVIFVPKRCELVGCNKTDTEDVRQCEYCECVFYCGRDHQKKDWSRHKLDCQTIELLKDDLLPKPFFFSREQQKFPIALIKSDDRERSCLVCHSKLKECAITLTDCCRLPICDDSHEYQINSNARAFCHRSHMLYTACSTHYEEGHVGDWRECQECNKFKNGARPFASTNGFCLTPCIEKFLPQGSMLTHQCNVGMCENRMLAGHSAATNMGGLYSKGNDQRCPPCSRILGLPL
jgi:hypothetical protein